ncbi:MAG: M81 family metallopeptidase, partial [Thermomicrobiales bacterium]|nr:M81 family metallopeptidase [Thermomicrobiales bacterium]
MPIRVAAAQIAHETNVFSVVPTDSAAFAASGLRFGDEIIPAHRKTNSEFAGFITGAARERFELLPLLAVWATPSGLVTAEAIDQLTTALTDGLKRALAIGPLDGVLLALHGAMVTARDLDGDAALLETVRAVVGPAVPIVATLDLHANLSERMVVAADLLLGYETYPHVDMAERGQEAATLLGRLIRRELRPTAALRKPPMLPTSQRMTTERMPMRALFERAHRWEERADVIDVTIAGGFPPADVPEAGFGVLVATQDDSDLAARIADDMAALAWELRHGFLGGVTGWPEAAGLIRALGSGDLPGSGPIVLVDIADNPWTGGPGDSAELVRFLLRERVAGAAVALVKDPAVVAAAGEAGSGATIDVLLGGKTDTLHGEPLPVRAYVRLLSDGCYVNDGPMMAGLPVDLGPTAVLLCRTPGDPSVPAVEVLVTSRAETPIDLMIFRAHGIEPARRRVLGLKGKGHFRAAFEPIARRVTLVEGPGITGADLSRLAFRRLRRPIWPLDPD